ncbi:flippase [Saccharicrinis sp. FJH62]|uniref:flippase n=1 Tax=Saccharicrinis sp. FJH62 TaxID=3344657 RepID=UPI0035D44F7A
MNRLKELRSNKNFKRVAENFFSLSILNGLNFVFPLILIPYLTRVLGVDGYGVYAFSFSILSYCMLLARYGFEFSATRQIAIVRSDKHKLNKLFYSVLFARIGLIGVAFIILNILILLVPKFTTIKEELFYGAGIFVGSALIPVWFFQGMENMKFMTLINFLVRLSSTVLIFVWVKSPDQIHVALGFQSVGYIFGGLVSIILAIKLFKLSFVFPHLKEVWFQLKDGWHLFISTLGMNFYRESNTIILGLLTNEMYVGYYAAAEKIIKAVQAITSPFVNAIYPFFSRKLNDNNSEDKSFKLYNKVGIYFGALLLILTVLVLLFSPWGVVHYLGSNYEHSILTIQILSFVVFLGGLNYYYGIIGLVNMKKEKYFTRSVWVAGVISIVVCVSLSNILFANGAALAMVSAELILFVQIMLYQKRFRVLQK